MCKALMVLAFCGYLFHPSESITSFPLKTGKGIHSVRLSGAVLHPLILPLTPNMASAALDDSYQHEWFSLHYSLIKEHVSEIELKKTSPFGVWWQHSKCPFLLFHQITIFFPPTAIITRMERKQRLHTCIGPHFIACWGKFGGESVLVKRRTTYQTTPQTHQLQRDFPLHYQIHSLHLHTQ